MGNREFVIQSIAYLASMPPRRVASLLKLPGSIGLKAVCLKAGLSQQNVMALKLAEDACKDLQLDGSEADIETFSRRMIERTLTSYQDLSEADQVYLLDMLVKFSEGETRKLATRLLDEVQKAA